ATLSVGEPALLLDVAHVVEEAAATDESNESIGSDCPPDTAVSLFITRLISMLMPAVVPPDKAVVPPRPILINSHAPSLLRRSNVPLTVEPRANTWTATTATLSVTPGVVITDI